MGCCSSAPDEEERRGLLINDSRSDHDPYSSATNKVYTSSKFERIPNNPKGILDMHGNVSETPVETSNWEQKVLDIIVQRALKDFIDISQTTEFAGASYDTSRERSELYHSVRVLTRVTRTMKKHKKLASKTSKLNVLSLPKPSLSHSAVTAQSVLQRADVLNQPEKEFVTLCARNLTKVLHEVKPSDVGSLVVMFSPSPSAPIHDMHV